ncbi:gamma-glutamylaminecyclotransferase [Pelobates cultripes]|uniref:Gamma-glutamylaminecyclotransferase n=1 Tax=Pelobates cultripes TaxID=61616 RepID=A0AAD1VNW8_PELCU|nr:gamma-glutamylaminecyclotransferase [Pelobates cultripes]
MYNIFVYGTLKKGQPNHHVMTDANLGNAIYKGTGKTIEKYPLVIAQRDNVPFLLRFPGKGYHIAGEIYSIDDKMLKFLDEFESCPDMYQRNFERIEIVQWEDASDSPDRAEANGIIECFIYSTTTYQPEWLNLPYHESYDSFGNHGLVFSNR